MKKVRGVGVFDVKGDSGTRIYNMWCSILDRCYSNRDVRKNKAYEGCCISDDWLIYSNFKREIVTLHGFNNEGWQLDKDILFKGNKIYSKETCCFVPSQINSLLTNRRSDRGMFPVGVYCYKIKDNNRYRAACNRENKRIIIGVFSSPEEAFYAYKAYKEDLIREKADFYRSELDERVYIALNNWYVEITD